MAQPVQNAWQLTPGDVAKQLETRVSDGLSGSEASHRLQVYGKNEPQKRKKASLVSIFIRQFVSPLVAVLSIAALLAFVFEEWLEGIAIGAVLLLNAIIGFFMELQALRSMEALRSLGMTKVRVTRGGKVFTLKTSELVPGDLIMVDAGDMVAADCRVVEQSNLAVDEASLTGESVAVTKQVEALPEELPLVDRKNMIFKGTVVARGHGQALVTATAMDTEVGRITHLAQEAEKEATPLEKRLHVLSQKLIWLTLLLIVIIAIMGILQGKELYLMVKIAIALGIAAIPEGLPIVATIALARGLLRLAKNQVIVKKLSAVETLGQAQIIFTDKTGTLTENRLSVDTIMFESENFSSSSLPKQDLGSKAADLLIRIATLCNNASISRDDNKQVIEGDPLEAALLKFAIDRGVDVEDMRKKYERLHEIPFDSASKMMGTLHRTPDTGGYLACIKGAAEVVLKECDLVLTHNGPVTLEDLDEWRQKADGMAAGGLRTLAFAYSELDEPREDFLHRLILIGVVGFLDPPRKEIGAAIDECEAAGIRVIMVTGDHPETAKNIGMKIGLGDGEELLTTQGKALREWNPEETEENDSLLDTDIFARVDPEQKLDLVRLYQKKGYVVAMTGDGINDAPALKKSDIGVAMGERGTEAAKDVADMVLEDDAFPSIVLAIRQGRGIFQNIRHFVVYLLSCNLSEIMVVAAAALANIGTPLLPLQILFLNMVTDVFPALALGMSREPATVMKEPPRNPGEPIIDGQRWRSIIAYAISISIAVLAVQFLAIYYLEMNLQTANNLTFYTIILAQLWHVFNLPSVGESPWNNEVTRNIHVWLAILVCLLITGIAYSIPLLREVLVLVQIDWSTFWIVVPFSFLPVLLIQISKRLRWVA